MPKQLLRKVGEWNADLINGGSQGHSAIGRFFLGSVSRSVAEQARCSVRIAHRGLQRTAGEPNEIIIAAKNPPEVEHRVERVVARAWPVDTRIRLVVVDDTFSADGASAFYSDGRSIYKSAADRLATDGRLVSVQIKSGDPTQRSFLK